MDIELNNIDTGVKKDWKWLLTEEAKEEVAVVQIRLNKMTTSESLENRNQFIFRCFNVIVGGSWRIGELQTEVICVCVICQFVPVQSFSLDLFPSVVLNA